MSREAYQRNPPWQALFPVDLAFGHRPKFEKWTWLSGPYAVVFGANELHLTRS
jgi:hypothetical protein